MALNFLCLLVWKIYLESKCAEGSIRWLRLIANHSDLRFKSPTLRCEF